MYRLYSRVLDLYKQHQKEKRSIVKPAIEASIIALVRAGALLERWQFPTRATGGWWWIWRWRWEVISGWLEYDTVMWFRRLVKPGMRVLDIGAHIGYYSRLLSRLVGPVGEVIAYEPCPENYPLLLKNLRPNRHENVCAFQIACSDGSGTATLYVSPGHSNHSLKYGYTESHEAVEVVTTKVDDHLGQLSHRRIHFAKMDTEGAEMEVLEGMSQTIADSPDLTMVVELNPPALRAGGHSPHDLINLIGNLGFVPREIGTNGTLLEPDLSEEADTRNLLCIRPKVWKDLKISGTEFSDRA